MSDHTLSDIKDIITIAKPVIDPIISEILKPHLAKISKLFSAKEKPLLQEQHIEEMFTEYLVRTLYACENINILIFQNAQIKLKEIYHPLTIVSGKTQEEIQIDDFTEANITEVEKILISDTAGMGKSTLSKFVCLRTIENAFAIPILIELRNLDEHHTILDELIRQFHAIDSVFDKQILLEFLALGRFLIILDGFDEINLNFQDKIIKDLRAFINKTPRNYFILTSRPEETLAAFGDFQKFSIAGLNSDESFELIKKYDAISRSGVSDRLIADINNNFNQTKELLRNPFLVSLVYSTYTYNQDIPSSKATFYEEIYSALFKRHDLSKDGYRRPKKSKLEINQFRTILRELAFETAKAGTIVYTEQEILNHLETVRKKSSEYSFSTIDFLDDLLSSVPLFQRDGSKIKWAHKSLQDFFFADYIAYNSRKEEIILRIYNSHRASYMNMLTSSMTLIRKLSGTSLLKNC